MSRSGATLLNCCLSRFPFAQSFSQPLPFFYRAAKAAFFKEINYPETYYVLNNYFDESRYCLKDLTDFLDRWQIEPEHVRDLIKKMKRWSGQQINITHDKTLVLNKKHKLTKVIEKLLIQLAKPSTKNLITKEIHCEEFISTF